MDWGKADQLKKYIQLTVLIFAFLLLPSQAVAGKKVFWGVTALCAGAIAYCTLTPSDVLEDVRTESSHGIKKVETVANLRHPLVLPAEDGTAFYSKGAVSGMQLFDKNDLQRLYASRVNKAVRKQLNSAERRKRVPNGNFIKVEFEELSVIRSDDKETASVELHLGPAPIEVTAQVPYKTLESGNWVNIRFPDYVMQEDGATLVAKVKLEMRYLRDSGAIEIRFIEGTVSISAFLGAETDKAQMGPYLLQREE